MYLILRPKEEDEKQEVCIVQADSASKAKEIIGVPDSHNEWGVLSTELVTALSNAKEGYFVIAF